MVYIGVISGFFWVRFILLCLVIFNGLPDTLNFTSLRTRYFYTPKHILVSDPIRLLENTLNLTWGQSKSDPSKEATPTQHSMIDIFPPWCWKTNDSSLGLSSGDGFH